LEGRVYLYFSWVAGADLTEGVVARGVGETSFCTLRVREVDDAWMFLGEGDAAPPEEVYKGFLEP
jgi:hypothetical protein